MYSTYNDKLELVKGLTNNKKKEQFDFNRCCLTEFTCHSQCIFAIAWINDDLLCVTSGDQTTIIYDIETGNEIDILRGHTMSVRSVCKLYSSSCKSKIYFIDRS